MISKIVSTALILSSVCALQEFTIEEQPILRAVPTDYVPQHPRIDNSTWGNVEELPTTHYHVDWNVDFEDRKLKGSVVHDLVAVVDSVGYLQLDVWNVTISDVYRVNRGAAYDLG